MNDGSPTECCLTQDAWLHYEKGAVQLVENLASALARQEAPPTSLPPPPLSPATARQLQQATGLNEEGTGDGVAEGGSQQHRAQQLMRSLDAMEDDLAATIDPDRLTGMAHLASG